VTQAPVISSDGSDLYIPNKLKEGFWMRKTALLIALIILLTGTLGCSARNTPLPAKPPAANDNGYTPLLPAPYNGVVVATGDDISFLDTALTEVSPELKWVLAIPDPNTPRHPLDWYGAIMVGPGPVYAIELSMGETTYFDAQGLPMFRLTGSPIGFLADGTIITYGDKLRSYSTDGTHLQERDPVSEALIRLEIRRDQILYGGSEAAMSPSGQTFVYFYYSTDYALPPSNVVLMYDSDSSLQRMDTEAYSLIFSDNGRVFTPSMPYGDFFVSREFSLENSSFTLIRNIFLPVPSLIYAGPGGSLLCYTGYTDGDGLSQHLAVYQEGKRAAASFVLPPDHFVIKNYCDTGLYTAWFNDSCFNIFSWHWPLPEY
jgi:hypothetical protein